MVLLLSPPSAIPGTAYQRPQYEHVVSTPYYKTKDKNQSSGLYSGFFYGSSIQEKHPLEEIYETLQLNSKVKWHKELITYLSESSLSEAQSTALIDMVLAVLDVFKAQKVVFEKTLDDTVLIKASIWGMDAYLEILFDSQEVDGYESTLTVFNGNAHFISASGTVASVIERYLDLVYKELSESQIT